MRFLVQLLDHVISVYHCYTIDAKQHQYHSFQSRVTIVMKKP